MSRRRLWKVLLLLILSLTSWGAASEREEEKSKKSGDDEKKGKGKREDRETEDAEEERPYYGRVEAVVGSTVWAGGRAHTSPLAPYLAPGMVVEVRGSQLRVLSPKAWAYYQGPGGPLGLGEGYHRVWWAEGHIWKLWPGEKGPILLVARYKDRAWQGMPPLPLPTPSREGWWLLTGGPMGKGLAFRLERFLDQVP